MKRHSNLATSIMAAAVGGILLSSTAVAQDRKDEVDSPRSDRPPTVLKDPTASTNTASGVQDSYLGADGGDKSNWWEALQALQRLEARRSRIAGAQIAQDTAKQSGQSGATDLASANKEFANPLTNRSCF